MVVGGVAPVPVTLLADGVTRGVVVICDVTPVVETVVVVGGFGSHVQQSLASGSKSSTSTSLCEQLSTYRQVHDSFRRSDACRVPATAFDM